MSNKLNGTLANSGQKFGVIKIVLMFKVSFAHRGFICQTNKQTNKQTQDSDTVLVQFKITFGNTYEDHAYNELWLHLNLIMIIIIFYKCSFYKNNYSYI